MGENRDSNYPCRCCGAQAVARGPHGIFCSPECARLIWRALSVDMRAAMLDAWYRALPVASAPDRATEQAPIGDAAPSVAEPAPSIVRVEHVDLNVVSLTREEMGRASWTFLHAVGGALYDGDLDDAVQAQLDNLIKALTMLYPCEECRGHFVQLVRENPPNVKSGAGFRQWLCGAHNLVNMRLGKPCIDCATAPRVGCEHSTSAPR